MQGVESGGFCGRRRTADTTQTPAAFRTFSTAATTTGSVDIGFVDVTATATSAIVAVAVAEAATAHMQSVIPCPKSDDVSQGLMYRLMRQEWIVCL